MELGMMTERDLLPSRSSASPKKRGSCIGGWDGAAASDKERRSSAAGDVGSGGGAAAGEDEEGEAGRVTLHSPHKKAKVHASDMIEGSEGGDREDDAAQQLVVELATVAELMNKRGKGLQVRRPNLGHQLAVFWHRDRPYVLNDSCPHRGAPLSEGDIEDLVASSSSADARGEEEEEEKKKLPHVVCPLHFYKFALASGRCSEGDDWSDPVRVYEAWVEGDRVMAKLPRLQPLVDDEEHDDDDAHALCAVYI